MSDTDTSKGGRPSKQDLAMTGSMTKREQSAALKEFRQRMLLNPQSPKLIEKLFSLAFDDEAKNQSVALKILSDRILPVAGFTQDGKANSAVQINITGLNTEPAGVVIDSVPVGEEDE